MQAFVTPVNIGPEIDRSALAAPRRRIRQVYGQWLLEVHNRTLPCLQDGINALPIPVGYVAKNLFGEIDGTGQPDAARAEGARGMAEYLAPRRIVQIHGELVGKHELDAAQCVLRPRLLAQGVREILPR